MESVSCSASARIEAREDELADAGRHSREMLEQSHVYIHNDTKHEHSARLER